MTQSTSPSEGSSLKIYSIGIAAENMAIRDAEGNINKTLYVTPHEKLAYVDGELKYNPTQDTVTGVDATGKSFSSKATTAAAIPATWMATDPNRHTPPNIRRGERVLLWRFADLDTFLWTELGWDRQLRKLETVAFSFSGTQDENDNTITAENSYIFEVSSHKGTITLSTSKANSEKCTYLVQFNMKNGTLTIADDLGQMLFLDSVNQRFFVQNKSKTSVLLDKQNLTLTVPDTFTLNATNNVNITTKNFTLKADAVTLTVTNAVKVQCETFTGTASGSVEIDSPSVKIGGVTITNGNVQMEALQATSINCSTVAATVSVTAPNI